MSMTISLELIYRGFVNADGWREDRAFQNYLEPEMGAYTFADRVEKLAARFDADVLDSEHETVIEVDADVARSFLRNVADIDPCVPALPDTDGTPSARVTFYR